MGARDVCAEAACAANASKGLSISISLVSIPTIPRWVRNFPDPIRLSGRDVRRFRTGIGELLFSLVRFAGSRVIAIPQIWFPAR